MKIQDTGAQQVSLGRSAIAEKGRQRTLGYGNSGCSGPLHMTFLTAELDDFSPTGEGEAGAAITETTHAIAAAKLQRDVQRDIK